MKEPVTKLVEVPLHAVDVVHEVLNEVTIDVEKQIAPVRKGIFKRFPTLFILAVTFGVSMVFFSIEVILSRSAFVMERPWTTLGIGLMILIITGTLYRKLE